MGFENAEVEILLSSTHVVYKILNKQQSQTLLKRINTNEDLRMTSSQLNMLQNLPSTQEIVENLEAANINTEHFQEQIAMGSSNSGPGFQGAPNLTMQSQDQQRVIIMKEVTQDKDNQPRKSIFEHPEKFSKLINETVFSKLNIKDLRIG